MITIREILSSPSENTEWLYLPSNHDSWTLDTEGVFSLNASEFSPDSNEYLPKEVTENGWIEVVDGGTIEEIVDNVKMQLNSPSIDEIFKAFIFYYENDAFLEF